MQLFSCIIKGTHLAAFKTMDAVFKALADPTRRALLDRLLEQQGQTLTQLVDGLGMRRQSVAKHLAVLEAAGLVNCRWQGREKLRQLLGTGRWRALYRDSQGWLAVRVDVELPEELQATRDSPWRQAGIALSAAEAGDLEKTIEHAERALRDMPWQQTACSLRVQAARALGREEEAQARLADCRAYFPSGALR